MKFNIKEFVKDNRSFRILILGATTNGKTYFASEVVKYINLYIRIPILMISPKNSDFSDVKEWNEADLNIKTNYKRKISKLTINKKQFSDYSDISEFAAAIVLETCPAVLYLEEFVEYVSKDSIMFPKNNPLVYKILQQGAADKANLICCTQMLAQTNLAFLRQSSDVFVFKVRKSELRYLEDKLGLIPKSLNFDNVPKYSFYRISNNGEEAILYEPI